MNKIFCTIILAMSALCMYAAPIDDAKRLYEHGDYDNVITILEPIAKKTPKDAAANYYLGASYYKKGMYKQAISHLQLAEAGKWPAACRDLAEINLKLYNLDAANDNLDTWQEILDKAKKEYPDEIRELRERVLMVRNMLERVEKIEIIDVFDVDSVEFFSNYRLSPDAGMLADASVLPDEYSSADPRVVYLPQSGKEMFWGMPDDSGNITLVAADVLDDGSLDTPHSLGDEINDGIDADFPFLLDDGYTIYYGAKGDESLGGYDIFMTRRSPEGDILQPQNVGMPYNSPYNDYMMVIDETNNVGWWASDRRHIPGKVTIYTFVPSKMRVNHNPDDADLQHYALLDNAQGSGDLDSHLKYVDDTADAAVDEVEFFFPMSDGKVYTRLSQFKNSQARQAMKNLLKRKFDLEVLESQLEDLRTAYANGDKSKSAEILKLEKSVLEAPAAIDRITNQIISLESK